MSHPVASDTSPVPGAPSAVGTSSKVLIVCGAALGLMSGFGPLFFSVVGIFLKPMTLAFGWGRSDVAMLPMLAMAGTALGAPVAGYLADRIGWSKVIAGAIAFFGLSLGGLAVAPANHAYIATVGFLIGFLGAATTAAGYLAVLPRVFDGRLGMALGFAMIGTGVGGFFAPIAASRLSAVMDWRHAFGVCAVAAVVLGVLAHRLVFLDAGVGRRVEASVCSPVSEPGLTLGEAARGYRFWLIAVVMFVMSSAILGGFVHLAAFVSDAGLSPDVGAQAAGVVGAGLAIARVGLGVVLDRVFAPLVALATFIVGAVGFAIFLTGAMQVPALVVLAALLLGISTGSEGDLIPYLARKYFGKRSFGSIYGCLFGAATLGGAIGPFVYGLAFDRFRSYAPAHEVSCVVCIVGAIAIVLLGPYPKDFVSKGQ